MRHFLLLTIILICHLNIYGQRPSNPNEIWINQKDGMTILFITHDVGVIADDIQSMLCINQTLLACNNPHEVLSCSEMSKLYGIDAHLIHHHHH